MICAVIFDFDGLILDTEYPEFLSWQEVYREHGCEIPPEIWAEAIGRPKGFFDVYDHLEAQVGRPIDRAAIRARRRQRAADLIAAQSVLPGVEDYLADAQRLGMRVGVASSSPREWVAGHLARLGLETRFACLKCADDVRNPKPDPELYLAALEALGVDAPEALALEDSAIGIAAARAAGIFCVAVPNPLTRHFALEQANLRLASLAELPLEVLLQQLDEERDG